MRKITKEIACAWVQGKPMKMGNTMTASNRVWLHGNCIAVKQSNPLRWSFSLAGWNTQTTRERLNGLLFAIGAEGAGYRQYKGDAYFTDLLGEETKIDPETWQTIKF